MKKEIKKQWIEALLSKDYKQTKGKLHDSNGYCCLGVLCQLHCLATSGQWKQLPNMTSEVKVYSYLGEECTLPDEVVDWANLETEDYIEGENPITTLTRMNDDGKSFRQIALWIKNNIPEQTETEQTKLELA